MDEVGRHGSMGGAARPDELPDLVAFLGAAPVSERDWVLDLCPSKRRIERRSSPLARRDAGSRTPASKTVLLVDDDPEMEALIRIVLAVTPAVRLRWVATGAEALRLVAEEPVDLVLLDARLPDVDGFVVCRALRAPRPERRPRVVMLTSRARQIDRERGLAAGADVYLTKPFSPGALLTCVESLLAEREAARRS